MVVTYHHSERRDARRDPEHSKGTTAYRKQNSVPPIVVHPADPEGKRCRAVTSHLDIAPTLVSLTNARPEKKAAITRSLTGKDLAPLPAAPERASYSEVRDGALYCYNMFAYIDGDFTRRSGSAARRRGRKATGAQASPWRA
jgi:arylsulfatase A-like enzyme